MNHPTSPPDDDTSSIEDANDPLPLPYSLTLEEVEESLIATQDRFLLEKAADSQLVDCTYSQGAITQPIYSCLTCMRKGEDGKVQYAALCGSCALRCHADHEIEEVFEKRDIRCDCPTLAFRPPLSSPSADSTSRYPPCLLNASDVPYPLNISNVYNHNYAARYCRCDSEHNPSVDVMYQCDLCQDWFHDRCITTPHKQPGDEDLFLCSQCFENPQWDFLRPYFIKGQRGEERKQGEEEVDLYPEVTRRKEERKVNPAAFHREEKQDREEKDDTPPGWVCVYCSYFNQPREGECFGCEKAKTVDISLPTASMEVREESKEGEMKCTRLTKVPASFPLSSPHDIWLSNDWMSLLCLCSNCLPLMTARAPFLLESDDPPTSLPPPTTSHLVDSYLSSLPRSAVLNGLSAIQDWNEAVMEGLGRLTAEVEAGGGERIVTKEMIEEVVREAREECKRRRRERAEEEEEEGVEGEAGHKRGRFHE